jgi:hypothetical protein
MFAPAPDAVLVALALLVGAAIVSLRVILAPPVADSGLVVVRGEPGTGTSRAAGEAVAGVLAGWPLDDPRTAAVLDTASCINRHAVASAWLSGGDAPAARRGVARPWPAVMRQHQHGGRPDHGLVQRRESNAKRRLTDG